MFLRLQHHVSAFTRSLSSLPAPPSLSVIKTSSDTRNAREWIAFFRQREIPKDLVELNFARSSGPGGQVTGPIQFKFSNK